MQDFDRRLARAERESAAAQAELDRIGRGMEQARDAEAAALRELARLRLASLGSGGAAAVAELDGASRRVRELLDRRRAEAAEAEAEAARRNAELAEAAGRRDAAAASLAAAEDAARAALDATRARLASDPEWQRRRDAAADATRTAHHAADKAALAARDREVKGRPYLDDPLFAYLWRRGFGTPAYRGRGLVRMLDGFVADVARYEPARRAFALLTELPDRLASHAARMREAAEAAAEAFASLEQVAGTQVAPPLRRELDAAEEALQAAHAALAETAQRRSALAAGEDPATGEAAALMERALGQESLGALREAAARTPTPEDDAVVARLLSARRQRVELDQQLTIRRLEAKAARDAVEQLLTLRRDMRTRGTGGSAWSLDGALLGGLVGQVLGGAMTRDGFWGRMEQHRLPVPDPWGVPPAPSGGSPWGGDDGFKTGGGFGGGDFRSGGSF